MRKQIPTDVVREQFLGHVADLVRMWDQDARTMRSRDKLEGLAFSIMSALDGCSMALPGFQVVASPHPDDRAYREAEGTDYYAPTDDHPEDIAGTLHEVIYPYLERTR